MDRIRERLASESRVAFTSLFDHSLLDNAEDQQALAKSQMVGIFLAILELIRHHQVQVEQADLFGEIWIVSQKAQGETLVSQPRLHIAEDTTDAA